MLIGDNTELILQGAEIPSSSQAFGEYEIVGIVSRTKLSRAVTGSKGTTILYLLTHKPLTDF